MHVIFKKIIIVKSNKLDNVKQNDFLAYSNILCKFNQSNLECWKVIKIAN